MMAYSEDHIALAAEYALGTLNAEERAQVETMMSVDKEFAGMVLAWEHKLGALNQMVGSVEPRPEVWERIRAAIGHSQAQSPIVLPQAPTVAPETEAARVIAEAAGTLGADTHVDNSNVVDLAAHARRWRMIATATSAIAAALVVMIGIGASMPDLLPDSIRPQAKTRVVEVKTPAAPLPSAQYVAVLQKEGGGPAFILTVDGATRNFTVRKVE